MDKRFLVEQLTARLRETAPHGAGQSGKSEYERTTRLTADLKTLDVFHPAPLPPAGAVTLGAVVEVETEVDEITHGRTFFLAPVGAGLELSGPGGDGILAVVTPQSPIGRAVLGKRAGDRVAVSVKGEVRTWKITHVG